LKRKTTEDYFNLANERGFRWLGPEVPNTKTKTTWECSVGHRWEADYNKIYSGSGCHYCSKISGAEKRRKTPDSYHSLAKERGFYWIGPEVPNTLTKTTWQCSDGHRWEARYNDLSNGSGCPYCSGVARKTPEDYHSLAEEHGFFWIGPEVPNVSSKTWWRCKNNHEWDAKYNDISNGSGCPYCSGKARKTPDDYKWLAAEKGFLWLGPTAPNIRTKTKWQCPKGHVWEAPYGRVAIGQGCPLCSNRVPKTDGDYKKLARERGFVWLGPFPPNTSIKTNWACVQGHKWEADYNRIKQGSGCPFCYGNVSKTPEDYISLALLRNFRWLGPSVSNTGTKTKWECEFGHQWEASYHNIQAGSGCPTCSRESVAEILRKTPEDYHELAEHRGLRWLGPEVTRNNIKTYWECQDGHKWEADYSRIQQGSGCPYCYGTAPKKPKDYIELAKNRGFKWLGPEVPNTKANTSWRCKEGHKWESPFTTIQAGHGCPYCTGLSPKTKEDYIALAIDRGFKWLGPEVPNTKINTKWKCPNGHQWEANYHNIQGGTGCPLCIDMVHGQRVSKAQCELCEILGGHLNFPFGHFNIDIALIVGESQIAVEYDSWYWHAHKEEEDAARDKSLIENGWKVIRIKTNSQLPATSLIEKAIANILEGEDRIEIVLNDWGNGPTRFGED